MTSVYNVVVIKSKHIHVLLVALLCYGQLVASTHVVGHFHEEIRHSQHDVPRFDCSEKHSELRESRAAFHLLQSGHEHDCSNQTETAGNVEVDCGIYHAFLSLSGVFCITQYQTTAPLLRIAHAGYSIDLHPLEADNNLPIRAPPTHS